jgi:hypothetical protein
MHLELQYSRPGENGQPLDFIDLSTEFDRSILLAAPFSATTIGGENDLRGPLNCGPRRNPSGYSSRVGLNSDGPTTSLRVTALGKRWATLLWNLFAPLPALC